MNLGEIPGMYWDDEKKKYFRIQQNHHTNARNETTATYSRDYVNRAKEREKHDHIKAKRAKLEAVQILKRSPALQSSLTYHSTIGRETNLSTAIALLDVQAQAYVDGLQVQQAYPRSPGADSTLEKSIINNFVFDPTAEILYTNTTTFNRDGHQTLLLMEHCLDNPANGRTCTKDIPRPYSRRKPKSAVRSPMYFNTHHIKHSKYCFSYPPGTDLPLGLKMALGRDGSLLSAHPFNTSNSRLYWSPPHPSRLRADGQPLSEDQSQQVEHGYLLEEGNHAYAIAANPFLQGPVTQYAITTDNGIYILDAEASRTNLRMIPGEMSEFFALTWISPHVLASGGRSRTVILTDTREAVKSSAPRLKHDTLITNLAPGLQDTQIIAAGLMHKMKLYDLRMVRSSLTKEGDHTLSTPVFRFDKYKNSGYIRHGFSTLPDLGILASGGVDSVQLFSMRTGAHLRDVKLGNTQEGTRGNVVPCVQFVELAGDVALLAARREGVWQVAW